MIAWFHNLSEMNFDALMAVYEDANLREGAANYPYESATVQKQLAERDFADYLRSCFFRQDAAAYCVSMEDNKYISAVRVEKYEDGYLISALETIPAFRRRGYGQKLIESLVQEYSSKCKLPIYSHVVNRNKASMNLHFKCGFRVYQSFARYLDGSVSNESTTLIYEK